MPRSRPQPSREAQNECMRKASPNCGPSVPRTTCCTPARCSSTQLVRLASLSYDDLKDEERFNGVPALLQANIASCGVNELTGAPRLVVPEVEQQLAEFLQTLLGSAQVDMSRTAQKSIEASLNWSRERERMVASSLEMHAYSARANAAKSPAVRSRQRPPSRRQNFPTTPMTSSSPGTSAKVTKPVPWRR
jgi:hypothetical protein